MLETVPSVHPVAPMSDINPPHPLLTMLEGRAALEAGGLMLLLPLLRLNAVKGEDEPVMVLPGFMADDRSTLVLRNFIASIGYQVYPWDLGVNRRPMLDYLPRLFQVAFDIRERTGCKLRMVGWSRGGILSRELAREAPEVVERVITIGSPVKGGVGASSIGRLVQRETGYTQAQITRMLAERNRKPIRVPVRAIYSKSDGVVAWRACIDDQSSDVEHYEIAGSHVGMGTNAEVFRLVPRLLRD